MRVFIAENQTMLKTALTGILNLEDDIEVIDSAEDGRTALTKIRNLQPDIAILDIEMPKMSGLDVAEELFRDKKSISKIVILTTFAQADYFQRAVNAKVSGYLLKDSPSDELISDLYKIIAGHSIYAPELVTSLINLKKNPLSKREKDILRLVEKGLTTKKVAGQLFLSEGTVRNYMSTILDKLHAANRITAIQIAKKHDWI
ncbi:two-component response regulator (DesK) [Oenococcus oeni]|nr:two-component response regulator (DesK) [Oenococcus oeni]SYW11415.1 two-component response regulator (DesK) [Oenococcus oeni]SYW11534.1 two-component response regulator (DesK) [Oenococcus oeni]SYW14501.1 two-component response regulator (DesK) [Oenococcus oeni]SYW16296.1 two-component response regulator (DesK) [Oenococcus oeni]